MRLLRPRAPALRPPGRRATAALSLAAAALGFLGVQAVAGAQLDDPAPTVFVEDARGRWLDEVADPRFDGVGYWPVGEVPPRVRAATLALEDRRFEQHPGVDVLAVGRAVVQDLRAGEVVSGASTIAMQLARMERPGPRTFSRKLVEMDAALALTAVHGRERVLAEYLRLAPYANNIHGIAYAARRYLDKPVADLSWAEIAFLCALPQAPSEANPFRSAGRARARERADRILDRLLAEHVVTDAEHALAHEQLGRLQFPSRSVRPVGALHAVLQLHGELARALPRRALGPTPVVRATLDADQQMMALGAAQEALTRWKEKGASNVAVLVVRLSDGAVTAHVGSADYFDTAAAGAIDHSRVRRNAGSTLKPLLYAAALDLGTLRPTTVLDDRVRSPGGVENADHRGLGPMLPRQALGNSRNVAAVRVLEAAGPGEIWSRLGGLGLPTDRGGPGTYGEGLAIGGLPVDLQSLLGAYLPLATEGRVRALRRWEPAPGAGAGAPAGTPSSRTAPSPLGPPPFSAFAARTVTRWLADPLARLPSFPRLGTTELPFPAAVKTGTSQDFRDAWTVAWSDTWLVGVWVGSSRNSPMGQLTGFNSAAELTHTILLALHPERADGLSDHAFPPPAHTHPVRVCARTGLAAQDGCPLSFPEWLPDEEPPPVPCPPHDTAAPAAGDWLAIRSPRPGVRLRRDPEVPAAQATVAFELESGSPVPSVVWAVDGVPVDEQAPPYTFRWALEPGEHEVAAYVPNRPGVATSIRVRVD